jgi:hypothetical protein
MQQYVFILKIWGGSATSPLIYFTNKWFISHEQLQKHKLIQSILAATILYVIHIPYSVTKASFSVGISHRYLISRLSLQVFYLWRHVLSTVPPFILWWSNLEILFAPLHRSSQQKEPNKQPILRCLWNKDTVLYPLFEQEVVHFWLRLTRGCRFCSATMFIFQPNRRPREIWWKPRTSQRLFFWIWTPLVALCEAYNYTLLLDSWWDWGSVRGAGVHYFLAIRISRSSIIAGIFGGVQKGPATLTFFCGGAER